MHFIDFPLRQIRSKATAPEQYWFPVAGEVRARPASKKSHPFIQEGRAGRLFGALQTLTGRDKVPCRLAGCLSGNGASEQGLTIRKLNGYICASITCYPLRIFVRKVHIHSRWSSSEDIS
jgi:hypothetical protein